MPAHVLEPFAGGTALTAPFAVRDYVARVKGGCLLIGGVPLERANFVRLMDLTDDALLVYVVDLGDLDCEKTGGMPPPWRGAHSVPVAIFVGRPDGTAVKAFEQMAYQVTIESGPRLARVYLDIGGAYGGQDTTGVAFVDMWTCRRPLDWKPATQTFEFARWIRSADYIARPAEAASTLR